MTTPQSRFRIGRRLETDQYLHVHIRDIATAIIKDDEEGVVIDLYPFKDTGGDACASLWAHLHDLAPEEQPDTPTITRWQRTALDCYQLGEFRYLAEVGTNSQLTQGLRDCGDSLLRFIVSELSERESCTSFEDAVRRITVARNQLSDVIEDLEEAAKSPPIHPSSARFRVSWRIDLDASHPRDAAQQALDIHRDSSSIATHFTVHDTLTGETTSVDLEKAATGA